MEDTGQAFGEKFDSEGIPFEASARIYCTTVSFALISRDANMAAEYCFFGSWIRSNKDPIGKSTQPDCHRFILFQSSHSPLHASIGEEILIAASAPTPPLPYPSAA
ncbi:hypothetical protein AAHE18_13G340100 [Arachis hypogaea]